MARAKKLVHSINTQEATMATESAPTPKPAAPLPPKRRHRRGFFFWLLLLALIATAAWAISLYKENKALRDPEAQARQIVAEMRDLIILPEDEVPVIGPVDKSLEIYQAPFFQNAQDGDLLVVYRTTQQAFVYSPSRHILVNAGVLVVNPDEEAVPTAPADEEPAPETEEEI
jgi:hypothetical protein